MFYIGRKKKDNSGIKYLLRNITLLGVTVGLTDPWRSISAIENLERMGLCEIIKRTHLADDKLYEGIKNNPDVKKVIEKHEGIEGVSMQLDKGAVEITSFGRLFVKSCMA